MHPLTAVIWLAGLWYYFFNPAGKAHRVLGWAWLVTMVVVMTLSPRVYYVFPAFPLLFAAGSVQWESWLARGWRRWMAQAWAAALIPTGALLAPFTVPVLPVETYIRYARATGFQPPRIETHALGPLPSVCRPVRLANIATFMQQNVPAQ